MNEMVALILACVTGLLLGGIFFGGLWWTVQKGISSDLAGLWFMASRLLRTAIVMVGFYFVAQRDWRCVLACLLGFLASRIGITFLLREKRPPCA